MIRFFILILYLSCIGCMITGFFFIERLICNKIDTKFWGLLWGYLGFNAIAVLSFVGMLVALFE